jgi:hypothetical protein
VIAKGTTTRMKPPPPNGERNIKMVFFVTISQQVRGAWVQGQQRDRMAITDLSPWLVTAGLRLGRKRANDGAPTESCPKKKKHFF